MITAERFEQATGWAPEDDELDRCNCDRAGEVGHYVCGWCKTHDKPFFQCAARHARPWECITK